MEVTPTETRPPVLIVNDDPATRKMVAEVLGLEGYRTSQAPDGAAALAVLLSSREPLIVLLDDVMPYMSGGDVLEALAATDPALARRHAFILVGGMPTADNPFTQAATRLFPGVPMPFLPLPFSVAQLLNALSDAQSRLGGSN